MPQSVFISDVILFGCSRFLVDLSAGYVILVFNAVEHEEKNTSRPLRGDTFECGCASPPRCLSFKLDS